MAYTIKLGTFSKLENSTAQPVMTSWAEYTVTFKEGADFSNPVLAISADFSVLYAYNYAYMLGRYYWITDIQAVRSGYCSISLKVDVLATYKSTIGNTDLYVLRSSAAFDGTIKDNFYPVLAGATYNVQMENSQALPLDYSNGYYLVNIAGTQTQNGTLIQLDPTNYKNLIANLYTQINGFQIDDMIAEVVKRFGGNPAALLSSVMWFPFPFVTSTNSDAVYIGSWFSGVYGNVLVNPLQFKTQLTFSVVKHPQAATRGSYLNLQPYINYTMFLPGAGAVNLDSTRLLNSTTIYVNRLIDGFTGQIKYMVLAGNTTSDPVLANVTGQYGVPIRVTGGSTGASIVSGTANTIGSAITAIATGGASAVIGAVTAGIGTISDAMAGAAFSNETGGGIVNLYQQPVRLDTAYFNVPADDNAQHGRPLMQIRKPSALGGYMVVYDGYVEISGPLPEQQEIKRFLESGFFYS